MAVREGAAVHFTLSGKLYSVRIAARPLILNGQPCNAKLDRGRGIIWLADQLSRHERRRELFHELKHAFVDTHGRAEDDEADAVQFGELTDMIFEQFQQQGGDATLEGLNPEAEASPARQPTGMLASERRCLCDVAFSPGSIATEAPAWNADLGSWIVCRGAYCENCDAPVVWHETATADGMQLGVILQHPKPELVTGAAAGEWIEQHPRVCRVRVT